MPLGIGHKQFRAWITSGGQPLPMYMMQLNKATSTVSCFIPAEAGQHFAVNWQDLGTGVDSVAYVFLDGHPVPGRYLFGKGLAWRNGVRASDNTERLFSFGEIDGGGKSDDAGDPKKFGTITLKVRQIVRIGGHELNPIAAVPNPMKGTKGLDLCVKLGQETGTCIQPPATWKFKPYNPEDPRTYVTFVFKYRTQEFIDMQGFEAVDVEDSEEEDIKPMPPPRSTRSSQRKTSQSQKKESSPELSQDSSVSRSSIKRSRVASTTTSEPRKSRRVADYQTASSSSSVYGGTPSLVPTELAHEASPSSSPALTTASYATPASTPELTMPPRGSQTRSAASHYAQNPGAWNYESLASNPSLSQTSYAKPASSTASTAPSPTSAVSTTGVQAIMASISPYTKNHYSRMG